MGVKPRKTIVIPDRAEPAKEAAAAGAVRVEVLG
jgi:hypothetical protein